MHLHGLHQRGIVPVGSVVVEIVAAAVGDELIDLPRIADVEIGGSVGQQHHDLVGGRASRTALGGRADVVAGFQQARVGGGRGRFVTHGLQVGTSLHGRIVVVGQGSFNDRTSVLDMSNAMIESQSRWVGFAILALRSFTTWIAAISARRAACTGCDRGEKGICPGRVLGAPRAIRAVSGKRHVGSAVRLQIPPVIHHELDVSPVPDPIAKALGNPTTNQGERSSVRIAESMGSVSVLRGRQPAAGRAPDRTYGVIQILLPIGVVCGTARHGLGMRHHPGDLIVDDCRIGLLLPYAFAVPRLDPVCARHGASSTGRRSWSARRRHTRLRDAAGFTEVFQWRPETTQSRSRRTPAASARRRSWDSRRRRRCRRSRRWPSTARCRCSSIRKGRSRRRCRGGWPWPRRRPHRRRKVAEDAGEESGDLAAGRFVAPRRHSDRVARRQRGREGSRLASQKPYSTSAGVESTVLPPAQ